MTGITWQQAALALTIILTSFGTLTYTDLFGVLFQLKGMDYNYTGDITCGAECSSYIELNTSYWRVCFANYSETKYENETIFKKVSRSRTIHANLDKVENIITTQKLLPDGSWIPYDIDVDWNVPTYGGKYRPIKDGDCWERKKVNKIELVGHKDSEETIKWSFMIDDYVDIDPIWEASLKWHDNCQTREENGKFNVIIGKTYWVNDSDDKCKKIVEAKSLKNSPIRCVVDFDGKHKADCLDFNLTHRKIRFNASDLSMKDRAQIVIKIMKPNQTVNGTEMVEKAKMIRSFVVDPIQDMWIEAGFGEVVHFGENSTTIQLQDADTENLDDTFITSGNEDNNYGAQTYFATMNDAFFEQDFGLLKFNISSIASSQNIISSELYLEINFNSMDSGESVDIKTHLLFSNFSWTEGNCTNCNCPDGLACDGGITYLTRPTSEYFGVGDGTTNVADGEDDGWKNWSVTDIVTYGYENNYDNVTIYLNATVSTGTPNFDSLTFSSKEYTTDTSLRPYLNITYSEAVEDTTKPTYSNDGHNTTVAGASVLFYIEYDDNTALHPAGQYIFSTNNTGTWTNESAVNFTATPNWANVSKTLNSTEDLTISYRWYADDNAGNINDTGIFTLTTTSADTCTYSGSGNWAILCNDNCSLVSTDLLGNNFTIIGSSATPTTGFINLYNYDLGHISGGCNVKD